MVNLSFPLAVANVRGGGGMGGGEERWGGEEGWGGGEGALDMAHTHLYCTAVAN